MVNYFIKPHLDIPNSGNVTPVVKKDRWHYPVDKYQGNHYCIVHWTETEIYPVGSAIHPLNNWGLKSQNFLFCTSPSPPKNNQPALPLTHTNLQLPNHFSHKRTEDKSTLYFGIGVRHSVNTFLFCNWFWLWSYVFKSHVYWEDMVTLYMYVVICPQSRRLSDNLTDLASLSCAQCMRSQNQHCEGSHIYIIFA